MPLANSATEIKSCIFKVYYKYVLNKWTDQVNEYL